MHQHLPLRTLPQVATGHGISTLLAVGSRAGTPLLALQAMSNTAKPEVAFLASTPTHAHCTCVCTLIQMLGRSGFCQ